MNVLCVIPARGGSARIPRKNLAEVAGVSLVERAVAVARATAGIARTVVSTNCWDTAARFPQCDVVWRPDRISGPTADIAEAIEHALGAVEACDGVRYDRVVTLQPAVPVRTPEIIEAMLREMDVTAARAAVTGVPIVPWIWYAQGGRASNSWSPGPYPRSQDCPERRWQEINSVQIADRDVVLERRRWVLPLVIHMLPPYAAIDIDDEHDLARARFALAPILQALAGDAGDGYQLIEEINGNARAWA